MKIKFYILSSIFFILDIISKNIIKINLNLYESIEVIPNFFKLTYVINDGAAFSILKGKQLFLIILSIVFLLLIIQYINKEKLNNYKLIYYSLLTGGLLGNLFDRIIYKGVIDFLDFKILSYSAPIFNLADTFIVISVFLIILEIIKKDYLSKR